MNLLRVGNNSTGRGRNNVEKIAEVHGENSRNTESMPIVEINEAIVEMSQGESIEQIPTIR